MADRYATNAFNNFAQYEAGVFGANEAQSVLAGDNPDFLWPAKSLLNAPVGTRQPIQRGYIRMIANGFDKDKTIVKNLNRRRLHFQFNPDNITRAVTARNDVQMWMNQDPVQLTQAIPGDANFSFELMFNREAEVNSGWYRAGNGTPTDGKKAEAQFPTNNPTGDSTTLSASAVTDIGVIADLIVFDELIGQGVNSQLLKGVLANAKKKSNLERTAALKAAQSKAPTTTASATVTEISGGKITKVKLSGGGSGYVTAPYIEISGGSGNGTGELTAVIDATKGKVTSIAIPAGGTGSGYVTGDKIKLTFIGGGAGSNTTTSNSTSDAQDQIPPKFDSTEAAKALTANYGNSAFLVSTPVRIVFSSLFMVEGYITSTQVTFNKFNPNMVPTQCLVGVTMQALYIGFAREKTYLTQVLEDALNTEDTGGTIEAPDVAEQNALATLSKNLFSKISRGQYGSFTIRDFLTDDFTQSTGVRGYPSKELHSLLSGTDKIDSITQEVELTITYKGNTNPSSLPAVKKMYKTGQKFIFRNSNGEKWKLDDFGKTKGWLQDDDMKVKLILEDMTPLGMDKIKSSAYAIDDTATSKWVVEFVAHATVTPASGSGSFRAKQIIKGTSSEVGWADTVNLGDICTLRVEN